MPRAHTYLCEAECEKAPRCYVRVRKRLDVARKGEATFLFTFPIRNFVISVVFGLLKPTDRLVVDLELHFRSSIGCLIRFFSVTFSIYVGKEKIMSYTKSLLRSLDMLII